MSPLIALFQQSIVQVMFWALIVFCMGDSSVVSYVKHISVLQEMFERILYIWAMRHPASGYVQGINDLVTPFFVVFLQELIPPGKSLITVFAQAMVLHKK